jgi:glycosyltransferase involved in cell wall biosynthesis
MASKNNTIRSVAIISYFRHHTKFVGYKNVLRYTKPIKIFGIDYNRNNSRILLSHYFVHEFITRFKTIGSKFDVLHIMYGEDYFRFSHWLFPGKKIVVTFHQPSEILFQELSRGNYNGRVAGFTHTLTRKRLKKIDAAIVMTEDQKKVVSQFINIKKIHVIPLGVELGELNNQYANSDPELRNQNQLITVGEWQRDWDMYLNIVEYAKKVHPQLKFILVNKNITDQLRRRLESYDNIIYKENISAEELSKLYLSSLAMFLPLKSSAGNNALNEGLALGCPVISNLTFEHLKDQEKFIFKFDEESGFSCQLKKLQNLDNNERKNISDLCNQSVQKFSWESVSNKLMEVYKSILK